MATDESLKEKEETGLCLCTEQGFLAATRDRLECDTSYHLSEGLLEVKYWYSKYIVYVMLASVATCEAEDAALSKSSVCPQRLSSRQAVLRHTHPYFYQVQGETACTSQQWCGFVCMSSTGQVFKQRISFDPVFWSGCLVKLQAFFKQYFAQKMIFTI